MTSVHGPVHRAVGLLGLVGSLFPVALTAQAQGTIIVACANNRGVLRQVSSLRECRNSETPVQWNIAGPRGPVGPQGVPGAMGATGAKGATGATGAQGPVGPQGAKGDQGPQGVAGPAGQTGPAGPQGMSGAEGQQGAAGNGFRWRGEFIPYHSGRGDDPQYLTNDVVSNGGSAWIAVSEPGRGVPGVDPRWQMFVQQGTEGAPGLIGPAGPPGPPGPLVHGLVEYRFNADTFVVPPGVTHIHVELWGGGGAGGYVAATNPAGAGGGGGGGYFRGVIEVVPGETLSVSPGDRGVGDNCTPYPSWLGYHPDGESSSILRNDGSGVAAMGGAAGGLGQLDANGVTVGLGGEGGACLITGFTVHGSLCRPGSRGARGGALGVGVPGGQTPLGSVSLPDDAVGGGAGGYGSTCQRGAVGNFGLVLISW